MMSIAGADGYGTFLVGTDGSQTLKLNDWKMDRYEISNRQYKAFVDAGGYPDSSQWDQPFRDDRRTISYEVAMSRFVDRTGRPGPATWEARDLPHRRGRPAGRRGAELV